MMVILDWFCHWDKEQGETRRATAHGVSPAWSESGKSVVIMRDVQGNTENLHGNDPKPSDLTDSSNSSPQPDSHLGCPSQVSSYMAQVTLHREEEPST